MSGLIKCYESRMNGMDDASRIVHAIADRVYDASFDMTNGMTVRCDIEGVSTAMIHITTSAKIKYVMHDVHNVVDFLASIAASYAASPVAFRKAFDTRGLGEEEFAGYRLTSVSRDCLKALSYLRNLTK